MLRVPKAPKVIVLLRLRSFDVSTKGSFARAPRGQGIESVANLAPLAGDAKHHRKTGYALARRAALMNGGNYV